MVEIVEPALVHAHGPPGHLAPGPEAPYVLQGSFFEEVIMSSHEVAKSFTELCRSGKMDEAARKFWSDDVVSIEPMTGDMARLQGRKAVEGKGKWWTDNHDVHGVKVDGPFVNGDEFTVRFELDVTPKGKARMTMTEIALYKVKDGKVVEEKFFSGGA